MAGAAPDLSLVVVVPPAWRDRRGTTTLERVHTQGYQLEVQPIWFNGSFHLHLYPGLGRTIARVRPDLVHIDEEPYRIIWRHTIERDRTAPRRQNALVLVAKPRAGLSAPLQLDRTLQPLPCRPSIAGSQTTANASGG